MLRLIQSVATSILVTLFITVCVIIEHWKKAYRLFILLFICILFKFEALTALYLSIRVFFAATYVFVSVVLFVGWCTTILFRLEGAIVKNSGRLMGLGELYNFFTHGFVNQAEGPTPEQRSFPEDE